MGEKLRKYIKKAGLTQNEFAKKCGVSDAYISYLCSGFKSPSVVLLKRMADILGKRMEDLL